MNPSPPEPHSADSPEGLGDADLSGISANHDPLGLDLARTLSANLQNALPPPRGVIRKRKPQSKGPKREKSDIEPVGGLLDEMILNRGWSTEVGLRQILARWPMLVGQTNADHSHPESFAEGVLVVRADSSTWASALRAIAAPLVAELNAQLGQGSVKRIDVKGPDAPSWRFGKRVVRDGRGPRDTYG